MLYVQVFSRFQSRSTYSSTIGVLKILDKHGAQVLDRQQLVLDVIVKDFPTFREIQSDLKFYTGAKSSVTRLFRNPATMKFEFDNMEQIQSVLRTI